MKLDKIQLKLYAEPAPDFELSRVVPVFHGFIREQKLDDVLIDVADYAHVHQGPGVVLIAHASDYYFDLGEGRAGLLFSRKRAGPSDPEARLVDAFRCALQACKLLEQEPGLGLRFGTNEARLSLLDRLETPSSDASLDAIFPVLSRALAEVYGELPFELRREGSEKEPFALRIRVLGAPPIEALLSRLTR
jgi:hypothetical protein